MTILICTRADFYLKETRTKSTNLAAVMKAAILVVCFETESDLVELIATSFPIW